MKNKKGISLIVLVITIIVMIILAAAIIVSLNNNNIIGKAKDAVNETNLKQIQELAQTIWADAYIDGARTQEELYDAVMEGLEEAKVDKSKYTIIVTTSGVTVTTQAMNEYGFYFDKLYIGYTPDESSTKIGFVMHADGTAEYYAAISSTNNTLYCIETIESGITYSLKKATLIPEGSTEEQTLIFSDDGLTATYDDLTVTYSEETLHGVYVDRYYTGMSGENVVKFKVNSELTTLTVVGTSTVELPITSVTGNNHNVIIEEDEDAIPIYISADGTSALIGGIILKLESTSSDNNAEDEIATNEWVVAWVYKDGAWSDEIAKGGTAEGDFVAKLYPTGKRITPKSTTTDSNDIVNQMINALELKEGLAYKLVIEGNGDIPEVITESEYYAWQRTSMLGAFINKYEIENYYTFYITDVVLSEGIEGTCDQAFSWLVSLENVEISDSITKLADQTFYGCKMLKSIELSDNIIEVGDSLFTACVSLTNIRLPSNLKSIPSVMFRDCENLENITIPNLVETIGASAFGGCVKLKSITIPNTVISIETNAFIDCDTLTTVTIPENVTSIGTYAFKSCDNLESIVFNTTSIETLSEQIFYDCVKLQDVQLPASIVTIDNNAFYNCTGLTDITLPSNLSTIQWSAFEGCTSLKTIVIPNSVTYLGSKSFRGCTALESVTLSNSLEDTTNTYVFENCTSLKTLNIQNGTTEIFYGMFKGCTSLESITIPSTVERISLEAFMNCTSLKTVTINRTDYYYVSDDAFMNIASSSVIYVTSSTTKGYFTDGTNYDSSLTTITIK